jgi:NAD(P)-dependent dehydrogenase (short-subunit alcohol dehydrogenase family)
MKKVFITGANKSIGFETARQMLQKGENNPVTGEIPW